MAMSNKRPGTAGVLLVIFLICTFAYFGFNKWTGRYTLLDNSNLQASASSSSSSPATPLLEEPTRPASFNLSHNSSPGSVPPSPLLIALNRFRGRIGNHLFQYASVIGIARAQNRQIVFPIWFPLRTIFNLKNSTLRAPASDFHMSEWKFIVELNFACFQPSLMTLPRINVNLTGFFQSYKYFDLIQKDLRSEFTFAETIATQADKILRNISVTYKGFTLIGVHVRRGDFLWKQQKGFVAANVSYFYKAFDWMKSALSPQKLMFLVASDDLKWCRKMFTGHNVHVLPVAIDSVHLAVLARCRHVIISGGTFGWWAAWLAGGYVVYFNGYMDKNSQLGPGFCKDDYYPSSWVGLDN